MHDGPLPVGDRIPLGREFLRIDALGQHGSEVEVRPAIGAAGADRAGDHRGSDPWVSLEKLDRSREDGLAVGDGEGRHGLIFHPAVQR